MMHGTDRADGLDHRSHVTKLIKHDNITSLRIWNRYIPYQYRYKTQR